MNRRQALRFFAAAGVLLVTPSRGLAASADTLAARARDALAAGDADKALVLLLEARAKDPRNDRVLALLGRTYFQRGEAREALLHFQRAVRINPEDTLSRVMAETISQFPVPPGTETGKTPTVARPSSALSLAAKKERQALLDGVGVTRKGPWRLLVDAGHGGADPGVPGNGPREADVALDLALRMGRALVASRDKVVISLTRTADVFLPGWARAALAGYYGADAMVSLHATRIRDGAASGVTAYSWGPKPGDAVAAAVAEAENVAFRSRPAALGWGGQTFFSGVTRQVVNREVLREGATLAETLTKAMTSRSPLPVRQPRVAPLGLLSATTVPAIVLEVGLLSNAGDAALLAVPEKRQALAQALASAVVAAVPQLGEEKGS